MALSTIPCTICFSLDCDHPPACDGCMWHMASQDFDDCICSMLVEEHGHCPICISPPGGEHAQDCDDYEPSEEEVFPPGECYHPPCDCCMWHMTDFDCICSMLVEEQGHCPICISPPGGEHAQDCIYSMLVEEHGHCPICIYPPGGEHAQDCNYEPSEEEYPDYEDEEVNYDYRDPGGIWH